MCGSAACRLVVFLLRGVRDPKHLKSPGVIRAAGKILFRKPHRLAPLAGPVQDLGKFEQRLIPGRVLLEHLLELFFSLVKLPQRRIGLGQLEARVDVVAVFFQCILEIDDSSGGVGCL